MNNVKYSRDSQFELLRIVAMFFIVTHHLVIKGADTAGYITPYNVMTHGMTGVLINSFVVGGVNMFVLITGWYGVKHVWKGMLRLFVDCVVFGAVSYGLLLLLSNHAFNLKELVISMIFTKNWFVVAYMMLLLLAPIIEKSLVDVNIRQLSYWLFLLTVFNLFFGYYLGVVNNNGYNVVHFVWLYYIARCLRLSRDNKWSIKLQFHGIWIYAVLSLLLAFIYILASYYNHSIGAMRWFSYNNPILLASSISFFMWFSQYIFTSKVINILATGMFGVFLLHTTPYLIPFRNEVTNDIFIEYSYWGIMVEVVTIMIVCGIISIVINKVTNPFLNYVIEVTNKFIRIFKEPISYGKEA